MDVDETEGAADAGPSEAADSDQVAPAAAATPPPSAAPKPSSTAVSSSNAPGGPVELPRAQDWDPFLNIARQPSAQCIRRVQQDVKQICRDPPPGCCAFPDDDQSTVVHCLLAGTADTPYEGGMFYFYIACPDEYPMSPPRVKIITGMGHCRFNPNLYKNGKVCLSILNTWAGPSWQPVHSIASVLMSIQSLMNDRPYHNEPGFEKERYQGDVQAYNAVIRHETLRHAVLGMLTQLEEERLPRSLRPVVEDIFLTMFEGYEEVCEDHLHYDGQPFRDPFNTNVGVFQYGKMLEELGRMKEKIEARQAAEGGAQA